MVKGKPLDLLGRVAYPDPVPATNRPGDAAAVMH
jgi:hypothetical protein